MQGRVALRECGPYGEDHREAGVLEGSFDSLQTTKTLTLLEIPVSTARFGLPFHPTLKRANRADDDGYQCLLLLRSLGLAESNSASFILGGRARLIAPSHDIGSKVVICQIMSFMGMGRRK